MEVGRGGRGGWRWIGVSVVSRGWQGWVEVGRGWQGSVEVYRDGRGG